MTEPTPLVPRPGRARLLHPASRPGPQPLPVEALVDIAAGLARAGRSVPASTGGSPAAPRSIRLIGTESYDVWLITWPSGTGMPHHDHGTSVSVLQVVSGSLAEISTGEGGSSRTRLLQEGCSATTEPGQAHELWNPGRVEATSVHVHSPPLETVTYSGLPLRVQAPRGPASPEAPRLGVPLPTSDLSGAGAVPEGEPGRLGGNPASEAALPGAAPAGSGSTAGRRVRSFAGRGAEATSPDALR